MKKLKIKNTTGISNDTEIFIDNIKLDNVTDIEIDKMSIGKFITVKLTLDMSIIDIETEDFLIETIYGGKDICFPNCKGCESKIPSIQGCR